MDGLQAVAIIGAGGHGREILDVVEAINLAGAAFRFLGFVDDDPGAGPAARTRGAELLGPVAALADLDCAVAIGVGDPAARRRLDGEVTAWGRPSVSLVHPGASIGSRSDLGPGLVMMAGSRITTNVTAGRHVHLNVGATVSHDAVVGDHVTIAPGAHVAGGARVGDGAWIGAGAVVLEGRRIGAGVVVGAGAVVARDLPDGVTAVGVPARPRR